MSFAIRIGVLVAAPLLLGACASDPEGTRKPTVEERARMETRRFLDRAKIDIARRLDEVDELVNRSLPADALHELDELRGKYPFLDKEPSSLGPIYQGAHFARYRELRSRAAVGSEVDVAGWRDTRWGMSRKDVQGKYRQAIVRGEELVASVTFFGKPTEAHFRFDDDALVEVELRTWSEGTRDYLELKNLLYKKYGKPDERGLFGTKSTTVEVRGNPQFRPWLRYRSRTASAPVAEEGVSQEQKLEDI